MVKAEITIDFNSMHIGCDLLKREDATDQEWEIAKAFEGMLKSWLKQIPGAKIIMEM